MDWLRGVDLNHRPLGYEPNELPDCSTPQFHRTVRLGNGQTRARHCTQASRHSAQADLLRAALQQPLRGYNIVVRRFLVPAVLALAADLSAQTTFFPLKDVRPGMRGTGRTVFSGKRIEEFQ